MKVKLCVIGASAGGLQAIDVLLSNMGKVDSYGLSFVIVQHLAPQSDSLMKGILSNKTSLEVIELTDSQEILPSKIYVNSPGKMTLMEEGHFMVMPLNEAELKGPSFLITKFMTSVAENSNHFGQIVGIILSGGGSDGAEGLLKLKKSGGLCLVQDPQEAETPSMPENAISKHGHHMILYSGEMSPIVESFVRDQSLSKTVALADDNTINLEYFEGLAKKAFDAFDLNYMQYKKESILRGIQRRIESLELENIVDYRKHFEGNYESESLDLMKELLISYTEFFRDPDSWSFLATDVVPRLFDQAKGRGEFKAWSCGISTGQEVYTLSLILYDYKMMTGTEQIIRLFGTDVSGKNITLARQGRYSIKEMNKIPPKFHKYLIVDEQEGVFTFKKEIKDQITFMQHDVLSMAPFTKMNLVTCRNLLIYVRAPYQSSIKDNLSFALLKNGVIFLGRAEVFSEDNSDYHCIDPIHKITEKISDKKQFGFTALRTIQDIKKVDGGKKKILPQGERRGSALEGLQFLASRFIEEGVIFDTESNIIQFLGSANRFFKLLGAAPLSFKGDKLAVQTLAPFILGGVPKALEMKKAVIYRGVNIPEVGGIFDLVFTPLFGREEHESDYVGLEFQLKDQAGKAVSEEGEGEIVDDLKKRIQELEKRLSESVEGHSVTGEELQVTNEELMSSNEELMASNEELKSVNEELNVVNREHSRKSDSVEDLHQKLSRFYEISGMPFVFLDERLHLDSISEGMKDFLEITMDDKGRDPFDFKTFSEVFTPYRDSIDSVKGYQGNSIKEVHIVLKGEDFICSFNGFEDGVLISMQKLSDQTGVKGLVEKRVKEELQNYSSKVSAENPHMKDAIDTFVSEFTKKEATEFSLFSLYETAMEKIKSNSVVMSHQNELVSHFEKSVNVRGDQEVLEEILLSMLETSLRRSQKSKVEVFLDVNKNSDSSRAEVKFIIKDKGILYSGKELERVRNDMAEAKQSPFNNNFVGLEMVAFLSKRVGGSMTLNSEEGVGNTLEFTLQLNLV